MRIVTENEVALVSELVFLGLDRMSLAAFRERLEEIAPPRREAILAALSGYLIAQIAWLSSRAHPAAGRYRDLEALLRSEGYWRAA